MDFETDTEAVNFLKSRGYTLITAQPFCSFFFPPTQERKMLLDEINAVLYLQWEWDYGHVIYEYNDAEFYQKALKAHLGAQGE